MPPMGVEDRVDAVTSEPLNFAHEVLRLIVNRNAAQTLETTAAPTR